MTIKETNEFMERIKSHYQEFVIDDFKIKEWHKELCNYDVEDVNKKLNQHLKSELYGGQIPKLYFLTSHLIPTREKGKIIHYEIECQLCGKSILDENYDLHYQRCLSTTEIKNDLKKYFDIDVSYEKLMSASKEEFDKLYNSYLNKMLEAENLPLIRKKIILRCLYPDTEIDINELLKETYPSF